MQGNKLVKKHIKNSIYYYLFGDEELVSLMHEIKADATRMVAKIEDRILELIPAKNQCTINEIFAQRTPPTSLQVVKNGTIKTHENSVLVDFIVFNHRKKEFLLIDFYFSANLNMSQIMKEEFRLKLGCEILSKTIPYSGKCYVCTFSSEKKAFLTRNKQASKRTSFDYLTGRELCTILGIDYSDLEELWKTNQSSNLRLVSEFIRMPPLVLTEGKTDWKHLKAAQTALREEGGFEIIETDIFEYVDEFEINDAELLKMCKVYSKTPQLRTIICLFDRDVPSTVKQVLDENLNYRDWGNNVYSFALPTPVHRASNPDICIEFYYKDEEIKRFDSNQRRLFLNNEFHSDSCLHKLDSNFYCLEANKVRRSNLSIIDDKVFNRLGENVALTKNSFADNILNRTNNFNNFDFTPFLEIFKVIQAIEDTKYSIT